MGEYKMLAIIIINYNGWKDTIECIESIELSGFRDFTIYVVDNASVDDSILKLEDYINGTYKNVVLIKSNTNLGFSGGNNLGIIEAKKNPKIEYFLLLNNDTLIDSSCLEELLKPLDKNNIAATIGKIMYANEKKKIWYAGGFLQEGILKPIHEGYNEIDVGKYEKQRHVSFATGCCFCLTRNCIEKIGLWSEDFFLYEEDVDYSYRIIKANQLITYVPKAIVYHKVSSSTIKTGSLSEIYQVRNRLLLIKKYKKGFTAIFAYVVNTMIFINRVRKGEYRINPMLQGICAFLKGEKGKHESIIS